MKKKWLLIVTFIQTRWLKKQMSRAKIERYQNKKMEQHFRFVTKNALFYQEIPRNEWPIMDKQLMMAHFDHINTIGLNKEKALEIALNSEKTRIFNQKYQQFSVGLSSGTSGHRGLFITDEKEQGIWAGLVLAKMLPKNQIFGHKIAFFLRANNDLYETIDSKVIQFQYYDLYQPMKSHIQHLNHYQPSILIAPASVLLDLATFIEENTLHIQPVKVISVAEVLEKRDEIYLKEVFQQQYIHQIYQCTEGFLGCTCAHGTLHLNEDIVKIDKEYLDEKRFFPIITDFKRTSQPIINYRLNDILVEGEPCSCGSNFLTIERIEGREDDVFIFENQKREKVKVFPDFIRRCILFVPTIREYQVIQRAINEIVVCTDTIDFETQRQIKAELLMLAQNFQFKLPNVLFEPLVLNKKVKLKRIVCQLK